MSTPPSTPATPDDTPSSFPPSAEDTRSGPHEAAHLPLQVAVLRILAAATTRSEVVPAVLEVLVPSLGWAVGVCWLAEGTGDRLRLQALWPPPGVTDAALARLLEHPPLGGEAGLPDRLWRQQEAVLIADVAQDGDAGWGRPLAALGLHGALAVPLLDATTVQGVLAVFSHDPAAVEPALLQTLGVLGGQIGQTLARLQAAQTLRASAERVRTIVAHAPLVLFAVDQEGTFTLSDGQGLAALGLTPGQHVGQSYFALYGHLTESVAALRRALAGEPATTLEHYQGLVFETRWTPTRTAEGTVSGVIGVSTDVTARERARQERVRLERRTQAALEALLAMATALVEGPEAGENAVEAAQATAHRLGVLMRDVLDCQGVGLIAIDADERLAPLDCIGLTPEQLTLWRERLAHWPRHTPQFVALRAQLRAGETVLVDTRDPAYAPMANPFGIERYLLAPLLVGTALVGLLVVQPGAATDLAAPETRALVAAVAHLAALVLERERLQREREEARAQALALREAQRRMDEFLSVASHEMRTPLTTIKGSIQLAQRRVRAAQAAASPPHDALLAALAPLLERLAGQTTRLTRLVDDVLDISRIQAGRLEIRRGRCELGALVREVAQAVQEGAGGRSIELDSLPPDPLWVEADPARLAQVVENYLTNALKYAPAERPVRVGLERDEGHARVWVQDQGVGIEAAEQAHIWERFYRVEGVRHQAGSGIGLGLGLYISRTIMERHGGAVGVESVPGHGSTFWFTLPLET